MNEYEERRVTRDTKLESSLNDLDNLASAHKTEKAESLEKINYLENQLQCRTNEIEEFQRNNIYFQSQLAEVNEELKTILVKVENQDDLKNQIESLSEEKEEMIKT